MNAHRVRRDRLRPLVFAAGCDALLVGHHPNIRYLSGFTGSAAQLLVASSPADDRLVTDDRYRERAEAEAPGLDLVVTRADDWFDEVAAGATVGVEAHGVSWARARALEERARRRVGRLRPVVGLVEGLRVTKDPDEIAALADACHLADRAFADLVTWLAPGLTERAVAVRLERTLVDLGADDRAFPSIVASGPNTAVPHHAPGGRRLEPGELVEIDFGARTRGYHSDMTRVVALGGVPAALEAVVRLVREAQATGVAAVRAGVAAGDVDAACRGVIASAGHGERFAHPTGHGVGLEIHEAPRLASGADQRLEEGMVLTVEPGVYLPGIGGVRIEDTVLVTGEGCRVLTATPRDPVIL